MKCRLILFLFLLFVSACGNTPSSTNSPGDPPVSQRSFQLIPMHYELLLGTGWQQEETGGLLTAQVLEVTKKARSKIEKLKVSTTTGFIAGQLVVVETDADEYVTTTIAEASSDTITLNDLIKPAGSPILIHNFYNDRTPHPNRAGYRAIADFAVRNAGGPLLNHGTHVVIGDSWVAFEGLTQRMTELLPNATIINKGVAGNRIFHVLYRFDKDVAALQPDYVWVLVGTNDYNIRNTTAYFVENITAIIERIKAINAVPIIFDPSVGTPILVGHEPYELTNLSNEYAAALAQLP